MDPNAVIHVTYEWEEANNLATQGWKLLQTHLIDPNGDTGSYAHTRLIYVLVKNA